MLSYKDVVTTHARIRHFMARQTGAEVADIELEIRKLAQSNIDAIYEIRKLKEALSKLPCVIKDVIVENVEEILCKKING